MCDPRHLQALSIGVLSDLSEDGVIAVRVSALAAIGEVNFTPPLTLTRSIDRSSFTIPAVYFQRCWKDRD